MDMFSIDWTDLSAVIALADSLGTGFVVIKHDSRSNYNITHASRPDRWNRRNVCVMHTN